MRKQFRYLKHIKNLLRMLRRLQIRKKLRRPQRWFKLASSL